MTDGDALIEEVLLTRTHFDTLKLPAPTEDALGRPVWTLQKKEISKQYRRVCPLILVDFSFLIYLVPGVTTNSS